MKRENDMGYVALKNSEYEEILQKEARLLLYFYADYCPACRAVAKAVDNIANGNATAVAKIDVQRNTAAAQKFAVRSVPHFIAIENGNVVGTRVGVCSARELEELFSSQE